MKPEVKEALLEHISKLLEQEPVTITIINKETVNWEPGKYEPKNVQTRGQILILETGESELKIDSDQFKKHDYGLPALS